MSNIITLLLFILILGVIVFVHELGHLLFAKKYGVYCPEFAIGMGPKLFSKKMGETTYSIRAFPIGGFVTMAGEEDDGENVEVGRRLFDISKMRQAMIMFAGAMFNFILGITLLLIVNFIAGVPTDTAIVGEVEPGTIAEEYGVQSGDEIIAVNGTTVESFGDTVALIEEAKSEGFVEVTLDSNGKEIVISEDNVDSDFIIGIHYAKTRNVITIVKNTFVQFLTLATAIVGALVALVVNFSETSGDVSGPVGIFNIVGDVRASGIVSTLMLVAALSINIGIFNLLPFPGLDGSKIVIAVGERILKRDMPQKLYAIISVGGLIFLLLLMVVITVSDITKLVN